MTVMNQTKKETFRRSSFCLIEANIGCLPLSTWGVYVHEEPIDESCPHGLMEGQRAGCRKAGQLTDGRNWTYHVRNDGECVRLKSQAYITNTGLKSIDFLEWRLYIEIKARYLCGKSFFIYQFP
jgi:hypothetical protein